MRLAAKLIAFLVLMLAGLIVVDGFLQFREERQLIRDGMTRSCRAFGRLLSKVMADAWQIGGEERMLRFLADANSGDANLTARWIRLDAAPGDEHAPRISPRALVEQSLGSETPLDDGSSLYAYFPVPTDGTRNGAIEVAHSLRSLEGQADRAFRRSASNLLLLLLVGGATVHLAGTRLVGRPLGLLKGKIDRIGHGELTEPLALRGSGELSEVADGLDRMCERLLQSQLDLERETTAKITAIEQARHADRLRTVGQLASGVAHELGTPLSVISGRASLIADGVVQGDQVGESARIVVAQAHRMTGIIQQLLTFARRSSTAKERVDVEQAAREVLGMVGSAAKRKDIRATVTRPGPHDVRAACGASSLQQVLTNLLLNAIHASPIGGRIDVVVTAVRARNPDEPDAAEAPCVRVDVRDEGNGIAAEHLSRVFEPFFTTKDVGEGTGLGLSIVHGILQDHGGWITVESGPGRGTCFTFHLPAVAP